MREGKLNLEVKDFIETSELEFIQAFIELRYGQGFRYPILKISSDLMQELVGIFSPMYDITLKDEIEKLLETKLVVDNSLGVYEVKGCEE